MAEKLKFKEMISKEQGLSYSKVKSQVESRLIFENINAKSSVIVEKGEVLKEKEKLSTIR